MPREAPKQPASWRVQQADGTTTVHLQGRLDDASVAGLWRGLMAEAGRARGPVAVDCAGVDYCGGAGLALLVGLEEQAKEHGSTLRVEGLAPRFRALYDAIDRNKLESPLAPPRADGGWISGLGEAAVRRADEWAGETAFVGEVSAGLVSLAAHPRHLRLREWWVTVEKAGTNALPIVSLISFLTGMIIAFQASIPMRQFGVDIFVVNLVALAMVRELAPIMTAIMLAGRSGSAFAAEIGTMKVNEEVAALTTMGLSPVRFLAVPRVLAGIAVTPVLTVYAMAAGVAGGVAVMMMRGFPLAALTNQLASAVDAQDVAAGLIKSFFFGAVVAGVGCLRGLQTGTGASAVGDSTTRSVVTGILLVVILDAIFAVLYYQLDF
jgi:phospholipid/cholesterol/gamma-HCH transport system permease protein